MTMFERTDQSARASHSSNPPPWVSRLIGLGFLTFVGLAAGAAPVLPWVNNQLGRWVWLGPIVGAVVLAVVWAAIARGDLAACRVWRVAWEQLADDQQYRFMRRLHAVEVTRRGLVVALRPPPPLTADELAKVGHQIASSEGMRLESARVIGRARWKPAHVEFRFLR